MVKKPICMGVLAWVWAMFVWGVESGPAWAEDRIGPPSYSGESKSRNYKKLRRKNSGGLTSFRRGAQNKLFGGVKNIMGAPMEIAAGMERGYRSQGKGGAISGFVNGMSQFVKRAGAGVVDVVTFPTRFPHNSYQNTMPPKGPLKLYRETRRQSSFSSMGRGN